MGSPNAQKPGKVGMWILSSLLVLATVLSILLFEDREWTTERIEWQAILTAVTVLVVAATVAPERAWWALRILAFSVFAVYFWYVITQFVIEPKPLVFPPSSGERSPMNALMGFLFFGVPCLIYSLWGSTWGKLGHENPENVTRGDIVTFYIAWTAQAVFLVLSVLAAVVALWKWFAS